MLCKTPNLFQTENCSNTGALDRCGFSLVPRILSWDFPCNSGWDYFLFFSKILTLFSPNGPQNNFPLVLYATKWDGMVWHGMAWHGMAWYGMVWYGMVWHSMVWYGWDFMVWCCLLGGCSMLHPNAFLFCYLGACLCSSQLSVRCLGC